MGHPEQNAGRKKTALPLVVAAAIVSFAVFGLEGAVSSRQGAGIQGNISGAVRADGRPISTGVLVVAASGPFTAPPDLRPASTKSCACYATSSLEDGTYSLSVRPATYTLYAYYTTVSDAGAVTVSSRSIAGVEVKAGASVPGEDFSWP